MSKASPADIMPIADVMARLRDPETGCPWDIEQDFASIAPYTIEEAHEVADAIARALSMSREERIERWQPMFENVRDHDVIWWRKRFTNALAAVQPTEQFA